MLKLMNTSIISHISCMCALKTVKSYFLSKFQVYNSVALTVITILQIPSANLFNNQKFVLFDQYCHFPQHPLVTTALLSGSRSLPCLYFTSDDTVQYLSSCVWLVSLSIMPYSFICVAANGKVSLFTADIPLYVRYKFCLSRMDIGCFYILAIGKNAALNMWNIDISSRY